MTAVTIKVPAPKKRTPIAVTRASEIEMRRARWLWLDWIPLGAIVLLAGFEDQGKSTWSLYIAARISRGQLEGEFRGKPANVAIQATEDDWEAIITPRLAAAGADMERVFRVDSMISLERDAAEITDLISKYELRLLVFDPVVTRIDGGRSSNDYAEVRRELEALSGALAGVGCSVLGLTHFNKGTGPVENRIIGSRAWRAVVRSVLLCVEDVDEVGDRLLVHNKNNYGRKAKSIRFGIEADEVGKDPDDGKPIVAPRIVEKGTSELTDAEAVAAVDEKNSRKPKTKVERCEEWLEARLSKSDEPELSKEIKKEAIAAGFSKSTVERAAKELRIETSAGGGAGTTWTLPELSF